ADSLATAFHSGEGEVAIVVAGAADVLRFTERFRCPDHPEIRFLDPTPRLFSFNNPYGSCPECTGFGAVLEYDTSLIVPNPGRSLREGAVDPWEKPRYHRERARLLAFARERGVSPDAPWRDLPEDFRHAVLHGTRGFKGMLPFLRSREKKRYKQYIRVFLRQYQSAQPCPACGGSRLRPEARYVKIRGQDIGAVSELPIREVRDWVAALATPAETAGAGLTPQERAIAAPILRELEARLGFLVDVGLGYLT